MLQLGDVLNAGLGLEVTLEGGKLRRLVGRLDRSQRDLIGNDELDNLGERLRGSSE